jgi:hypothetical protein
MDASGETLIRDLLANPDKFSDGGRAYDLLQAYFHGFPLGTLRPLLRSESLPVRKAAAFVVSELGAQARELVDDVIPLLESGDRYLGYHALEVLSVCCDGDLAAQFAFVTKALDSDDEVLRTLAMRLVSVATDSQLEGAQRSLKSAGASQAIHESGLLRLLEGHQIDPSLVATMINDPTPLTRRYGAIAARRLSKEKPGLFVEVGASADPDLRSFYESVASAGAI